VTAAGDATQPQSARSFRLRPRYRGLAYAALGVGGTLGIAAIALLGGAMLPLATGIAGMALGASYLASPTWRLDVVVDDEALEVRGPKGPKLRVAWADVVRVVASPSTKTCYVDGGSADKSLIVPGDGAPAPYDIDNKPALYDAILARVPADKVTTVETLEAARELKTKT
jgi:hypothetical protein